MFVAVLLAAVIAAGTVWMNRTSDSLTAETADQISSLYLRELSSATAKHLQSSLDYHFSQVEVAAQLLTRQTFSDEEAFASFLENMKETNHFSFLAFVDERGYYYDGTGAFPAVSQVSFLAL